MGLGTERKCKPSRLLVRRCKYDRPFILLYQNENSGVTHSRKEHCQCFFPARFVASRQPWAASGNGRPSGSRSTSHYQSPRTGGPEACEPETWDCVPREEFRPCARRPRAGSIPPGRRDWPGSANAAGSSRCENAASSFGPSVNGSSNSRIRPTVSASRRASSGRLTICRALARR